MYKRFGKRIIDIFIAFVATSIFFVPMLLISLWVKMDSKGPVLFRQLRFGKDLKPFHVYKFRTMSVDAPPDTPTSDFKEAGAYITRSGKIMRKLSLDELPQLLNVLKGTMSIIGPRPVVLKETRLIELRELVGANSIKPGVTGWAQVNGRDELGDVTKARMDGEYVDKLSFVMDMKCIFLTFWVVLAVKGNHEGNEALTTADDLLNGNLAAEEA